MGRVSNPPLLMLVMMFQRKRDGEWDDAADDDPWPAAWDDDDDGGDGRRAISLRRAALGALVLLALLAGSLLWRGRGEGAPAAAEATPVAQLPTAVLTDAAAEQPTAARPPTATPPAVTPGAAYDPAALAAQLLVLVNGARAEAGLGLVEWDETAARAAQAHANDMIARDYFSHWNPEGLGPEHRYALAGGQYSVRENLHALASSFPDGTPAPIDEWDTVIANAHAGLMNSPGHRATILDPSRTHVGFGLAYDPAAGQFRLAQEFTAQHVTLSAAPAARAAAGDVLRIAGTFGPAAVGNALLDLAYEPFPAPMSAAELAASGTYTSSAESIDTRAVDLSFDETLTLPADAPPGFYHVRFFVDLPTGQALVVDWVVAVDL